MIGKAISINTKLNRKKKVKRGEEKDAFRISWNLKERRKKVERAADKREGRGGEK